jgi:hypothetical protein
MHVRCGPQVGLLAGQGLTTHSLSRSAFVTSAPASHGPQGSEVGQSRSVAHGIALVVDGGGGELVLVVDW